MSTRSSLQWVIGVAVGFGAAHAWFVCVVPHRPYTISSQVPTAGQDGRRQVQSADALAAAPFVRSMGDVSQAEPDRAERPPAWRPDPRGIPILRGAAARPMFSTFGLMPIGSVSTPDASDARWTARFDERSAVARVERDMWRLIARVAREMPAAPWADLSFQFLGTVTAERGYYVSIEGGENWIDASIDSTVDWFSDVHPELNRQAIRQDILSLRERRLSSMRTACALSIAAAKRIAPDSRATGICVVGGELFVAGTESFRDVHGRLDRTVTEFESRLIRSMR